MKIKEYIEDKNTIYKSDKSFKFFFSDYFSTILIAIINPFTIPIVILNLEYGIQYLLSIVIIIFALIFLFIFIIIRLTTSYIVFTDTELILYNIFGKIRKVIKYTEIKSFTINFNKTVFAVNKYHIHFENCLDKISKIIYNKCSFTDEIKKGIEYSKVYNNAINKIFKYNLTFTLLISLLFSIPNQNKLLSFYYAVKGNALYKKYLIEKPINRTLMKDSYNYLLKSLSLNLSQSRPIWLNAIQTAHYLEDYQERDNLSQIAVNIYPNERFLQEVTKDKKRFNDLIRPLDKPILMKEHLKK